MAKIYERLLSTNINYHSRCFQQVNHTNTVLAQQIYTLGMKRVLPFFLYSFFYCMIDLLRLFQKRSFVLSIKHENQSVANSGTLLDEFITL